MMPWNRRAREAKEAADRAQIERMRVEGDWPKVRAIEKGAQQHYEINHVAELVRHLLRGG